MEVIDDDSKGASDDFCLFTVLIPAYDPAELLWPLKFQALINIAITLAQGELFENRIKLRSKLCPSIELSLKCRWDFQVMSIISITFQNIMFIISFIVNETILLFALNRLYASCGFIAENVPF